MKNTRLFKTDGDVEIVSAEDVLKGIVDRDSEFIENFQENLYRIFIRLMNCGAKIFGYDY